jgi:hypothetical protein
MPFSRHWKTDNRKFLSAFQQNTHRPVKRKSKWKILTLLKKIINLPNQVQADALVFFFFLQV